MAGYDYDSDSSGGNPYDEIDGPFMGLGNGGENEDIHVKDLKDACKLAWETAQNLEAFADGVEKTVGTLLSTASGLGLPCAQAPANFAHSSAFNAQHAAPNLTLTVGFCCAKWQATRLKAKPWVS
jgi:hypothetical protein